MTLRLERIPDPEVEGLMSEADVVVLPFRRITTSSSAGLALAFGRPLLVPRLPALNDLPDAAVARYDGSVVGLADALGELAGAPPERLAAMSAAARSHRPPSWAAIARRHPRRHGPGRWMTARARPLAIRAAARRAADDVVYRSSTLLLVNTALLAVLGFAFWAMAARLYSAGDVGASRGRGRRGAARRGGRAGAPEHHDAAPGERRRGPGSSPPRRSAQP